MRGTAQGKLRIENFYFASYRFLRHDYGKDACRFEIYFILKSLNIICVKQKKYLFDMSVRFH